MRGDTANKESKGRNKMLRRNIMLSLLIKICSVLCSLLVVPLTLDYLNVKEYGVWLTLSSVLVWFSFFDVGLGNGLRNYLTQSISSGDYNAGKRYLSTTFVLLCILCLTFALIIVPASLVVNLNDLFGIDSIRLKELRIVMITAVALTLLNFVLKNVGVIFMALQKYAYNDLLIFLGHFLALLLIWLLTQFTHGSLLYVTIAFTLAPCIVFLVAGGYLCHRYTWLRISFSSVDMSLTRQLMGKGICFFFIQITSCLVIFGSANLFITSYCGPEYVTTYNIAYKYMNVLAMGFTILISPLWSAYTDAYVKGDMLWIRKTFYHSIAMWAASLLCGGVMLALSPFVYHIWIGSRLAVPLGVSASVCLYLCLFNFNNCVTYLLNGLNTVMVQLISSILVTLLYFILIHVFAPEYGVVGISLCMSACYFIQGCIHLYQCNLILSHRASGIWLK